MTLYETASFVPLGNPRDTHRRAPCIRIDDGRMGAPDQEEGESLLGLDPSRPVPICQDGVPAPRRSDIVVPRQDVQDRARRAWIGTIVKGERESSAGLAIIEPIGQQ